MTLREKIEWASSFPGLEGDRDAWLAIAELPAAEVNAEHARASTECDRLVARIARVSRMRSPYRGVQARRPTFAERKKRLTDKLGARFEAARRRAGMCGWVQFFGGY